MINLTNYRGWNMNPGTRMKPGKGKLPETLRNAANSHPCNKASVGAAKENREPLIRSRMAPMSSLMS
jgi:hypothetical protein